jgi:SepF-like predicted cell division protein (DUF552 family)
MEQVIRGFLPWEAIAKKYFADEEEPEDEAPKKSLPELKEEVKHQKVKFDDLEDEEEDEESEEDLPAIKVSEETAELDFKDLDEPKPEPKPVIVKLPEIPKEEDPLKELESRASESLVLNL